MDRSRAQSGFLSESQKISPYIVFVLMLIYTFVASVCYTAIKAGLEYSPPIRFAGLRTLIGGISLIALLLVLGKPILPRRDLVKWIIPIGVLSTSITFGFMFSSPEFTGAGIATVLGNTSPLIIIVLAAIFLNEKITIVKITSLILGITGIIFIFSDAFASEKTDTFFGAVLATGTSIGIAVTAILLKWLKPGSDLIAFTGWQLIAGGLLLLSGSFFFESGNAEISSGFFIGLVMFLGVIGTAFTEISWFWLLQKYDAGKLSLYLFLTPVLGLLIAFAAFGETLQPLEVIGIIIIISALGLTLFNDYRINRQDNLS